MMDTTDNDLEFIEQLASKHKASKKKHTFAVVALLLGGITSVYSGINALNLGNENEALKKVLTQYQPLFSAPTLPSPYFTQDLSLDFTKSLPNISVSYLDAENKTCNYSVLEIPPSLSADYKDKGLCAFDANKSKKISAFFGGGAYLLKDIVL